MLGILNTNFFVLLVHFSFLLQTAHDIKIIAFHRFFTLIRNRIIKKTAYIVLINSDKIL